LPVASILFVGAGILGAGTLKDLSLALFIGLTTGTYSSIFVATPILATLREREPAMKALTKRVAQRGASPVGTPGVQSDEAEKDYTGIVTSTHSKDGHERGPRNQPKRRSRRR
jgi:preprotein translocase subunit SecF